MAKVKPETLGQKQRRFTAMVMALIQHAYAIGYELSLGEAWRPEETAQYYAKAGKGIADSLHCVRLAIDLNVFKDGVWLMDGKQFADLGTYWKSLANDAAWGQDFKKPDGNHFSLGYMGKQ
jgi:hypothetical protein